MVMSDAPTAQQCSGSKMYGVSTLVHIDDAFVAHPAMNLVFLFPLRQPFLFSAPFLEFGAMLQEEYPHRGLMALCCLLQTEQDESWCAGDS